METFDSGWENYRLVRANGHPELENVITLIRAGSLNKFNARLCKNIRQAYIWNINKIQAMARRRSGLETGGLNASQILFPSRILSILPPLGVSVFNLFKPRVQDLRIEYSNQLNDPLPLLLPLCFRLERNFPEQTSFQIHRKQKQIPCRALGIPSPPPRR